MGYYFNYAKKKTNGYTIYISLPYFQGDTSILRNVADKLPDPIGWRKWKVGDWFGNIDKDRTPIPVRFSNIDEDILERNTLAQVLGFLCFDMPIF